MPDTIKMRGNPRARRDALEQLRRLAQASYLPIVAWEGREYAVISGPKLVPGPQRVEAIDLTAFDEGIGIASRAARFASRTPEPFWPAKEGETDAEIIQRIRRQVIYLEPDEGHCALLTEAGDTRWCDAWTVGFIVRVSPGTPAEHRQLGEDVMDALEESVDAGGRIW